MMKKTCLLLLTAALLTAGCSSKNGSSSEETTSKAPSVIEDDLTFAVDDKGIYVLDGSKNRIKEIEMYADWLEDVIRSGNGDLSKYIIREDFDFDGDNDIAILVYDSGESATYEFYRYDPEKNSVEEWDVLNMMYALPKPDRDTQTLSYFTKNGTEGYFDASYKWNSDERLMPIKSVMQYKSGGETYRDYFEYNDSGEEKCVKKEHVLCNDKGELTDEVEELPIE